MIQGERARPTIFRRQFSQFPISLFGRKQHLGRMRRRFLSVYYVRGSCQTAERAMVGEVEIESGCARERKIDTEMAVDKTSAGPLN